MVRRAPYERVRTPAEARDIERWYYGLTCDEMAAWYTRIAAYWNERSEVHYLRAQAAGWRAERGLRWAFFAWLLVDAVRLL